MQRKSKRLLIGTFAMVLVAAPGLSVVGVRNTSGGVVWAAPPPSSNRVAPGLVLPPMNPVRGKTLFASKGCVVCHSINKVGGTDALALDAATMAPMMNPFEFTAKMWRGAAPMIMMQQNELGHQIEFTGQELADIIAFVHNSAVQKSFTTSDIPPEIRKLMDRGDENDKDSGGRAGKGSMKGGNMMGPGSPMGSGGMMGQEKKKP